MSFIAHIFTIWLIFSPFDHRRPDLDPEDKTNKGAVILNHIMKYTTREHFQDFCFILAGYKHKIDEKIFK